MVNIDKEVPYCTVFLVVAALACHSIVLYGNLDTASAMQTMGQSTKGWSKVGLGLARSLDAELDPLMGEIDDKLGEAINQTLRVQQYMDVVVSLVGKATEDAEHQANLMLLQGPNAANTISDTIMHGVSDTIDNVLAKLTLELDQFLQKIKPALLGAGQMILKFSDKITLVLESFSLTLDKVQKMFDQIMSELNRGKKQGIKDEMIHDTYALFDVSGTGFVSAADLVDAAKMYGISALQGTKPKDLVKKYDNDGDGKLDRAEFVLCVDDPSIPKAMAVILRAYAKRLTTIAGNVGAARKRDEVALAVTKYLQLVVAKNRTKLDWVADALGNGSMPLAFTADIFKNLAQQTDNADVGAVVIRAMLDLHPRSVMQAVDLMADNAFWEAEGFDPNDHPLVMKKVTQWISHGQKHKGNALLEVEGEDFISSAYLEALPAMAAMLAEENVVNHQKVVNKACAARRVSLFSTDSSKYLLHHLLGGVAVSDGNDGAVEAAKRSVSSGVPAAPETLLFAKYLAWNASATAERFQMQSFEYTSESSSALDSFANQMQGMVKKITGFINMVEKYSSPDGIDRLEKEVRGFAVHAGEDMRKVVRQKLQKVLQQGAPQIQNAINHAVENVGEQIGDRVGEIVGSPLAKALKGPIDDLVGKALQNNESGAVIGDILSDTLSARLQTMIGDKDTGKMIGDKVTDILNNSINEAIAKAADHVENMHNPFGLVERRVGLESFDEMDDMQQDLHGAFDKTATLLRSMVKLLPQATDRLKFAKQEVAEAAKVMDTVFAQFQDKGPAVFDNIATLWRVLWSMYFVFLLPMTLGLLYYAFWASGYFGGPTAAQQTVDNGGKSVSEQIFECCGACNFCVCGSDTQLGFWSFMILLEVVCLVIFSVSLVLCVLAGVKSFMAASCSEVFVLNDDSICVETINVLRSFLSTFSVDGPSLDNVCSHNQLLTCDLISTKMRESTIFTSVFSFIAAMLSFQLIVESARLHTRARYCCILDTIDAKESDRVVS